MDFDSWTTRSVDVERRRRLAIGYLVGIVATTSFGTALALATPEPSTLEEEENILDVVLAEEPEPEPEPEMEPEPQPEPEPLEPTPPPQAPVVPEIETPVDVPDDAPEEAEPVEDTGAEGDPYAGSGAVRGPAPGPARPVQPIQAPPAPKPQPAVIKGPVRMSAKTAPPQELAVGSGFDAYPAAAKAAGIEGTVVVSFVISEQGLPTQVKAQRGPPELRPACEARVKATKYSPATDKESGKSVAVFHHKRCVYRIKT